jgi:hypothetical protein
LRLATAARIRSGKLAIASIAADRISLVTGITARKRPIGYRKSSSLFVMAPFYNKAAVICADGTIHRLPA